MRGLRGRFGEDGISLYASALFNSAVFLVGAVIGCLCAVYGGFTVNISGASDGFRYIDALYSIFRYPALVILFGLSVAGVVLVPAVMGFRGFLLAFAVASMTRTLGFSGAGYALSVFWLHCFAVLPCMIFLSAQGFVSSLSLISAARGEKQLVFKKDYLFRTGVCAAVLAAASALEFLVTPSFSSFVLRFSAAG